MDVVLVGLPGSGKTAVGRRLARRHEAEFIDLDETIARVAGASIQDLFATEGEAGFRARERAVVEALGPADRAAGIHRVVATGGGAVVDPRNRWRLYRDRLPIWLDVRSEVLAQRLRHSRTVRPLVAASPDAAGALRRLATSRERFYAAAVRVNGVLEPAAVLGAIEAASDEALAGTARSGTTLLDASTPLGRIVIGDGIAGRATLAELERLGTRRAIVVSEPVAWGLVGERVAQQARAAGLEVEVVLVPEGEDAKRLSVVETAARALASRRVERGEPIVAVGGGALGDTAGFLAATWLRGVPIVQVPTTLVAQIDAAIGGKTAVDLPEGKNLVGAFHQPAAVVIDVAVLRSLPERQRRAALGEAVKMGVLGDERLLELLDAEGRAIAVGDAAPFEGGAVAELVERCAWAKVEVVSLDQRETEATGGRIALNLGHSLAHALEAADGYRGLLHGEAVAFGLRGACRIGLALGLTPESRASRIEALLDRLELGRGTLPYAPTTALAALGRDKKHAGGRLRWVLPTTTGVGVRTDVPDELVASVLDGLLAGTRTAAEAGR